jgi:hypothetical protein
MEPSIEIIGVLEARCAQHETPAVSQRYESRDDILYLGIKIKKEALVLRTKVLYGRNTSGPW